jgi:YDG domain/Bacterial Ig-like domain (group 3)
MKKLNIIGVFTLLLAGLLLAGRASAAVTSITVGAQTGALTYGTAGHATYALTFPRTGSSPAIAGLAVAGLPAGATYSLTFTNNTQSGNRDIPTDTLTINIATNTPAGTNTFTVSSTSPLLSKTATLVVGRKAVTITGVTAAAKSYDGTTVAALSGGTVAGVTNGDVVTVVIGTGTFSSKVPGSRTVVASGFSLGGANAGNYTLSAQPTVAAATISPKPLTLAGLTAGNKIYNKTTAVTLTGTAALQAKETAAFGTSGDGKPYTGDTVTLAGTPAGVFASANAGTNITVIITGLSLTGQQAANYTLTPNLAANITPASLTGVVAVSKTTALIGTGITFTNTFTVVAPGAGTPTGSVQFLVDGSPFGSPAALNTNRVAILTSTNLPAGSHAVAAAYAGDGNFYGCTNSLAGSLVITNPPAPVVVVLSVQRLPDGNQRLAFTGSPTSNYVVQASTGLAPVGWAPLSTNTAAGDGSCRFDDLTATNYPARFYRAVRY